MSSIYYKLRLRLGHTCDLQIFKMTPSPDLEFKWNIEIGVLGDFRGWLFFYVLTVYQYIYHYT